MKHLEDLAKLLHLPSMFPEHNMEPTCVPEYMLTRSLDAPNDPPQEPQLQLASNPVPSPVHKESQQTGDEMDANLIKLAVISGVTPLRFVIRTVTACSECLHSVA